MRNRRNYFVFTFITIILVACAAMPPSDTTSAAPEIVMSTVELSVGERDVIVWKWSSSSNSQGNILFSHGAASAPVKYQALFEPWVKQGYTVYASLHVDSTDHPETERYQGFASWIARLEDARLVADYMNSTSYIAAGHSYGALVALTLGGAKTMVPGEVVHTPQDERAALVLAFSSLGAIPNFVSKEAYSYLSVPALIETGTLDVPIGSKADYITHLDAFHAAPERDDVYGLVLEGVDHYFGGAIGRPELDGPKQLEQLELAIDISSHIMSAYVQENTKELEALSAQLSEETFPKLMRK